MDIVRLIFNTRTLWHYALIMITVLSVCYDAFIFMRCSNGIFTVESAFFGGKNANELSSYRIAIQNKWSIYIHSASNRECERKPFNS